MTLPIVCLRIRHPVHVRLLSFGKAAKYVPGALHHREDAYISDHTSYSAMFKISDSN